MTMNRAFSLLSVKSVDDDQRIITGIATTPQPDRVGDIVDPMGAKYAAEVPLLWMHKHDKPVGLASLGRATKAGIPFTAIFARIAEPGELKNLVDFAWQSVKSNLVKGVSIGFLPKKYEILKSGGMHFTESEIFELSLATIPMNAAATIQTVKALSGYRDGSGSVPLIARAVEVPHDMNGAVRLVSAKSLASVPLKARR
jgi:HK97 family phage prohead protease